MVVFNIVSFLNLSIRINALKFFLNLSCLIFSTSPLDLVDSSVVVSLTSIMDLSNKKIDLIFSSSDFSNFESLLFTFTSLIGFEFDALLLL